MSEIMPEAVVCIPSFRRPEGLKKTLASLAAQKVDFPFAVVVVDNDGAGQQGLAVAHAFFAESGMAGQALVEPTQGNCYAINTAFRTARQTYPSAEWLLMIDDDEAASPNGLPKWFRLQSPSASISSADRSTANSTPRLRRRFYRIHCSAPSKRRPAGSSKSTDRAIA
ncbi:glycosyltransferase [Agrobacterium tumefaciens]|uniref:glycosyltransferase family 2 protein n=1 Tax=Agrobacterium tumefaciens TaxID=358 RepID=UPI00301372B7